MGALWVLGLVGLVLGGVEGFEGGWNVSTVESLDAYRTSGSGLMVGISLIKSAAAKGAVCLDGSPPAFHLHRGYGSGARNWLVHLEGGGWCNNRRTCIYRKGTNHGSSYHMEKEIPFVGILSNKPEENPDFYNWNRVKVRYCDGASFSGEGYYQDGNLFFRGQRIWTAAMEELMAQGMRYAGLALLSGCSAGGLSTILHCDDFRSMFPGHTRVKCVADAGYFLDVVDVAGIRAMRNLFEGVVSLQGVAKNLPRSCTSRMHPASCFFPQNLVDHVQTPLFLLNAAYDFWQVLESIVPPSADPHGQWTACKRRLASCSPSQISIFQDFRNHMLNSLKGFSHNRKNGVYLNSCFAHCQSEIQETWYSNNSPQLHYTRIAQAVGNWYFDRSDFRAFDCPYPCDRTCHNIN